MHRFEPVFPVPKDLHWLLVEQQIQHKRLVTAFKPHMAHSQETLHHCTPERALHSKDTMALTTLWSLSHIGHWSFTVATPTLLNNLSLALRSSDKMEEFGWGLQSHLYDGSLEAPLDDTAQELYCSGDWNEWLIVWLLSVHMQSLQSSQIWNKSIFNFLLMVKKP